jgi:hypothetical protein
MHAFQDPAFRSLGIDPVYAVADTDAALSKTFKVISEPCANPRTLGGPIPSPPITVFPLEGERCMVVVNKRTHQVRFQDETESGVVIAVEPKN